MSGATTSDGTGQGSATTVPREQMPRWVPRAILLFFAAWAVAILARWTVQQLRDLLIIMLVSLFLSFAIEPAVNRLERLGVRRGLGTLLVFLMLIIGFVGFGWIIGAALADQISQFVNDAPGYIEDSQSWIAENLNLELNTDDLIAEFQDGGAATELATRLAGDLVGLGTSVLNLLLQILTGALFTYYLVADGPRLRRVICSRLPEDRQREVLRGWDLAIEKTGGYIYSRSVLAVISAVVHWIAFSVIGSPFPLALGLWVGIMSQFIPVVGTYIAGALPVLIGLLNDPSQGLWMLVVIVVYQQIENYLIAPPITAQTMEIHVAVAFGAVIAGAGVLGIVGALIALPAAATFQAFISAYGKPYEVIDDELTRVRGRRLQPTEDDPPLAP